MSDSYVSILPEGRSTADGTDRQQQQNPAPWWGSVRFCRNPYQSGQSVKNVQ